MIAMFREHRNTWPRWFTSDKIEIRKSDIHGIGVFAIKDIGAHELVEACPVVTFGSQYLAPIFPHIMNEYSFAWKGGYDCLCLGWGGVYNHSTKNPNARWKPNYDNPSMDFYSIKKIEAGEEILVRYVPYTKKDAIWFSDADADEGAHFDIQGMDRTSRGKLRARGGKDVLVDTIMTKTKSQGDEK